jgi:hypothetical protein
MITPTLRPVGVVIKRPLRKVEARNYGRGKRIGCLPKCFTTMTHNEIEETPVPKKPMPLIERSLEERRRYNREQKRKQRAKLREAEEKANPTIVFTEFWEVS